MKLATTYGYLKKDLNQIEQALEDTVKESQPVLHDASLQLIKAGGKRLRPVFAMLSSMFGDYQFDRVKNVAVSLELIHMASLVHDDVIDDSNIRRGETTVKAKWDNQVAMLTGDYIFSRALEKFTEITEPRAHQLLSKTMIELTSGEIEQIRDKYDLNQNFRTYLRRIRRKTALLISSSSQLGAIVSHTSDLVEKALFRYGYNIGMSYQIIDDILDFTGTEDQLGKPAGSDLLQGNITLPVIYALEDPYIKNELERIFTQKEEIEEKQLQPVIEQIAQSSAITKARNVSDLYLKKAYDTLDDLPDVKAKNTLKKIANYIGSRKV
ncbi:heptaprenyl diphosphate synthase component II [Gracilibacillus halophilus YIM-C55.5]|uniref:Heptaprenyl diphosphate synthase component 2 n=1 Tax=Gracilibacillus halophilus YIM-C55.5 TaxID=1308866 RepID=N4WW79_9BACI|nr:heptaprenyl diphosphate synthase component II [Gracilibacillus halophilus]ENH97341.1 heptaprenyl diphosphate synthase component II [Gracilibacillus halophilus YIM-C55.5]